MWLVTRTAPSAGVRKQHNFNKNSQTYRYRYTTKCEINGKKNGRISTEDETCTSIQKYTENKQGQNFHVKCTDTRQQIWNLILQLHVHYSGYSYKLENTVQISDEIKEWEEQKYLFAQRCASHLGVVGASCVCCHSRDEPSRKSWSLRCRSAACDAPPPCWESVRKI